MVLIMERSFTIKESAGLLLGDDDLCRILLLPAAPAAVADEEEDATLEANVNKEILNTNPSGLRDRAKFICNMDQ